MGNQKSNNYREQQRNDSPILSSIKKEKEDNIPKDFVFIKNMSPNTVITIDKRTIKNVELIRDAYLMQENEILEFEEIPGYLKEIEEIWKNTEEYTDSPILKLPVVLVWEISLYLNPKEIISWESTCKHFR